MPLSSTGMSENRIADPVDLNEFAGIQRARSMTSTIPMVIVGLPTNADGCANNRRF